MIEKLKSVLFTIKDFFIGLLLLAVYVFYNKNKKAEQALEDEKYTMSMEKTTEKEKKVDEEANQSYTDYLNAKREYDMGGTKDVPPSSGSV